MWLCSAWGIRGSAVFRGGWCQNWTVGYSLVAESRPMREKMVIKVKIYVRHTFREYKCVFLLIQQETIGELLEAKVIMGLPLAALSPSLQGKKSTCLFTAMKDLPPQKDLPWQELVSSTDLGRTAFTAVLEVISTCLKFAFKVSSFEFGLVPSEDSLYWKISPHPFKDRKVLKLLSLFGGWAHSASCRYGYSLNCKLSPPTLASFHRSVACEAIREVHSWIPMLQWRLFIKTSGGWRYYGPSSRWSLVVPWIVSSLVLPCSSLQKAGAAAREIY